MKVKKPVARYKTAMLIDDNEIDNLINEKMIEGCNFAERVYVYTSGKGALEYLKNLERDKTINKDLVPDIIFLDINMPVMDGFQFIEEYKKLDNYEKHRSIIVMLTTSINPSDREVSEKDEAILKFINKPLNQKYLDEL